MHGHTNVKGNSQVYSSLLPQPDDAHVLTHTSNMHCVIQLECKHGVIYIINGPRLFFLIRINTLLFVFPLLITVINHWD